MQQTGGVWTWNLENLASEIYSVVLRDPQTDRWKPRGARSITAMMPSHKPQDRYKAVWLIFFMLGLGTLLPWNFFMTATMYFKSRLGPPQNNSGALTEENRDLFATTSSPPLKPNFLNSIFNNGMTICAMLPLLVFTCLNSFLHQRIPQALRILGSMVAILLMFALTAVLVKVDLDPIAFFTLTMIQIVIISSSGAILQGSLFGLAGLLPASYTVPIMSGQGLAGIFAAVAMIFTIASGSELEQSAFGYFIIACGVTVISILCYLVLPHLKFYQYYQQAKMEPVGEWEAKMDLIRRGMLPKSYSFDTSALCHTSSWVVLLSSIYFCGETEAQKGEGTSSSSQKPGTQELEGTSVGGENSAKSGEEGGMSKASTKNSPCERPSIIAILKQIWVLALSVCFIFIITICVFPSVTAEVQSTIAGTSDWSKSWRAEWAAKDWVWNWRERNWRAESLREGKEEIFSRIWRSLGCRVYDSFPFEITGNWVGGGMIVYRLVTCGGSGGCPCCHLFVKSGVYCTIRETMSSGEGSDLFQVTQSSELRLQPVSCLLTPPPPHFGSQYLPYFDTFSLPHFQKIISFLSLASSLSMSLTVLAGALLLCTCG
ncbi:equilibrative nucleoside transporter 1-like isoform X2 [Phascolarctos cinereus]